jgi:hypothetical protein
LQTAKFSGCHSGTSKNYQLNRGNKWRSFYSLENKPHDQTFTVKNFVTYVTLQISSRGTLALTVRLTPIGTWEIIITNKMNGYNIKNKTM